MIIQIIRRLSRLAQTDISENTEENILAALYLAYSSNLHKLIRLVMIIVGYCDIMKVKIPFQISFSLAQLDSCSSFFEYLEKKSKSGKNIRTKASRMR